MSDDREIGIPGDTLVDELTVFPMSDELPASAYHVTDKIKELHRRGIDGRGVKVAICDTSGKTDHPFLPKEIAGKIFTGETAPDDGNGHGTHCAGIVVSIAPGVDLICAKVLSNGGSGSTTGINAGRVWAAKQGADIISESLGDNGGPPIQADLTAYDQAYEAGVSICVAALGNAGYNGRTTIGRPGSYSTKNFGIGALKADWKTPTNFSSGGPEARFAAPGENITSCRPRGGWVNMSGTSMATPLVAGLLALILSWRRSIGLPDLTGVDEWESFLVRNKLVDDIYTPGRDVRTGFGSINIEKCIDFLLDKTAA